MPKWPNNAKIVTQTHWPLPVWRNMVETVGFPESWNLSPEAMNPDFESIIKHTKQCIPFLFSHENIFKELHY